MARLAACLLLALVAVGVAAAARGDPQEQFTRADQARAKAMLLRASDFGPGVKASKAGPDDFDFYCEAIDESDLVLTGKAESLDFDKERANSLLSAGSQSYIYKTTAQSEQSWRRSTSAAGTRCAERAFRKMARELAVTFVSFARKAFPRLAPQTAAYRVIFKSEGVPMTFDFVMLRNGRAQAGPLFMGVPSAYPRVEQVRLTRIIARREAAAMHGE